MLLAIWLVVSFLFRTLQCDNLELTNSVATQMPTAVLDALLAVLLRPLSIHHQ